MITIRAQAIFVLPVTLLLIGALEKCASLHYDSTCKATADERGLLWSWRICCQPLEKGAAPLEPVRASFRDLDTLLKVCEFLGHLQHLISHEEMAELHRFKGNVSRALHRANDLYDVWREEVA